MSFYEPSDLAFYYFCNQKCYTMDLINPFLYG